MQMPGRARRQGNRIGPGAAAAAASSRTRSITDAAKPEDGSILSACALAESGGPAGLAAKQFGVGDEVTMDRGGQLHGELHR